MATLNAEEQDVRLKLLNTFMSCPHRDTNKIAEVHKELSAADPRFYPRLAAWYHGPGKGDIRDIKEVFCATLLKDPFVENREVGLALFRQNPIFMKDRIKGFIKGKIVKLRVKTGKKIKIGKKTIDETKIEKISVGLKQNMPTSLKKEIKSFLEYLESDNDLFDSAVMKSAKSLKGLYASIHRRPPKRHNEVLFLRKYPEDSKLSVYKKISGAKNPEEAANLIVKNKIPYRVAVGLIDNMTPTILAALINSMTPQEVINNIASLKDHGTYDNEDLKKLIESKLEKAKKSSNVATLKSKTAKNTGRIKDESIEKKLDEISDAQIKRKGTITVPTALLVDKSSSMETAIETGKKVAAIVSGISEAPLYVLAFDNMVTPIEAKGKTLTDWENAFRGIKSHGWTSIGVALDYLLRKKTYVEQIIVVTDEGENRPPFFADVYSRYQQEMKVNPNVIVIHIESSDRTNKFSQNLKSSKIEYDIYTPSGSDYYGLPGLIPLLTRKTKLDLLYEIMETPLPVRRPFNGSK